MEVRNGLIRWLGCLVFVGSYVGGCMAAEDIFTSGRIENVCSSAIPACGEMAGCVLNSDQYLSGEFPGGQVVIVRTESERTRIVARFLLSQEMYPGTLMSVRGCSIGCAQCDEQITKDKNLFEVAGNDGILEYDLDVEGRGDHEVEFFSDMAAKYLFTVGLEE